MKFIKKERASGLYNLLPYMTAINCFEIPWKSLPVILLTVLVYLFYDLERKASKFWYYIGVTAMLGKRRTPL